jgi:hypothetical protein
MWQGFKNQRLGKQAWFSLAGFSKKRSVEIDFFYFGKIVKKTRLVKKHFGEKETSRKE